MATSKAKILVLHGDAGTRTVLRQVASSLEFEVDDVGVRKDAIDRARRRAPHLLVAEWSAVGEPPGAFFDELLAACGGYEPQVIVVCPGRSLAEVETAARGLGLGFVMPTPLDQVLVRQAMAGAVAFARKAGEPPPPPGEEDDEPTPTKPSSPPAPATVVAGYRDERSEDDGLWDGETSSSPLDLDALFESAEATAGGTRLDTDDGTARGTGDAWAVEVEELAARQRPGGDPGLAGFVADEPTQPGDPSFEGLAGLLEPESSGDGEATSLGMAAFAEAEDTSPGRAEATEAGERTDAGEATSVGAEAGDATPAETTDEIVRPPTVDVEAVLRAEGSDRGVPLRKEVVILSGATSVGGIVVESAVSASASDGGDLVIESDHPEPLDFGFPELDEPRRTQLPPPPAGRPETAAPKPPAPAPRPSSPPATPRPSSPPAAPARGEAVARPSSPPVDRASSPPPPPPRSSRVPVEVAPGLPSYGDLSRVNAVELFAAAIRGKVSGALSLETGGRIRSFAWSSGRLVGLRCSHLSDGLIPYLFARGDLGAEGGDKALAEASESGADHAEVLFRLGLVDPSKLVNAMGAHAVERALEALAWTAGAFSFDSSPAGPKGPQLSGVHAAALVVTAMVRQAGSRRLVSLLDLPPQATTVAVEASPVPLADVPLPPKEARVRDLALSGASIGEISDRGGLSPDECRAAVRAFYVLGAIGVDLTGGASKDRPAPPRPSRAPAPARPTAPPSRPTAPPAAPTPRPSRVSAPSPRSSVAPGRSPSPPPAAASAPPPSPVGSGGEPLPNLPKRGLPSAEQAMGPEELARGQARALWDAWHALERGEPLDALDPLRENIEADRSNPIYHLYLGWTTYRVNPESVKLAERCVLEASRLDRECSDPFYLMAEICTLEGDPERAERFLEKARRLEAAKKADDASVLGSAADLDIQRELRRAMKDYLEEEKRSKEARDGGKSLFDRFLRGK